MANNFLTMCCECHSIKIRNQPEYWLSENENPIQYQSLVEAHRERISHGYCPPCEEGMREEIRKFRQGRAN